MDNKQVDLNNPNEAFIVHIPMCTEGMWLRLAKLDKDDIHETFLHIPFGKGVVLPARQLHAGHYGERGNHRFHAVISNIGWYGVNLLTLPAYAIKKNVSNSHIDQIVKNFDNMVYEDVDSSILPTSSPDEQKTVTAFKKNLTKFNPHLSFAKLMTSYNREYKEEQEED